jgi:hypothetical protein
MASQGLLPSVFSLLVFMLLLLVVVPLDYVAANTAFPPAIVGGELSQAPERRQVGGLYPYGTLTVEFIPDCFGMAAKYVVTWRQCSFVSSDPSQCPDLQYWPETPLSLTLQDSGCQVASVFQDSSTFFYLGCEPFFIFLRLLSLSLSISLC